MIAYVALGAAFSALVAGAIAGIREAVKHARGVDEVPAPKWRSVTFDAFSIAPRNGNWIPDDVPTHAITLNRPWTDAILQLGKDVENRSWPIPAKLIGKPIALHAGQTFDGIAADEIEHLHDGPRFDPAGSATGIVGVVVFDHPIGPGDVRPFGAWDQLDSYAWPIMQAYQLDKPIPARGKQRFWRLTDAQRQTIADQIFR